MICPRCDGTLFADWHSVADYRCLTCGRGWMNVFGELVPETREVGSEDLTPQNRRRRQPFHKSIPL